MRSITIKELHERTGAHVRRAVKAPIQITYRGKLIAVLAAASTLPHRRRQRTILAEYATLLAGKPTGNVLEDLDAIRGER